VSADFQAGVGESAEH